MKNGLRQLCRAALVLVLAMIGIPLIAGPAGAADGVGTMTVSPTYLVSSSTGNGLSFTYTAAGTMTNGSLSILVPTAFPTPTASGFDPSGIQNLCSGDSPVITSVAGGHLVTITSVGLTVGSTCQINYGLPGFSGGFTAPAASATYIFTTQQRSNNSSGALTNIGTSPQVVVGDSGTGTMGVSPLHVVNSTAATTLTFTYTAARAMSNGKLELDVPAGWSAPSTTASAPGYTTASCGTVGVASSTISVTGITIASAATCTIAYGSKASGGPGATTPTNGGINTFTVRHAANNSATPVEIGTFPKVSVTAPDGAGTMTASPTTIISGSTGNGISFTYAPGAGGTDNGTITILVPTAFPTPTNSGFDPAGVQNLCSGDSPVITSVAGGHLITITSVTIAANATCQVNYGLPGFSGGWTAPAGSSTNVFTTSEKSYTSGALTALGTSPVITVGTDGTGTMTIAPPHAVAGSAGNTETLTYTAATSISNGVITVDVPAGWSAPDATTTSAPGYTTSTCGTVAVAAQKITVSAVTKAAAATCTVTYGSKASGGPGATAPSTGGSMTFTTQEKSSAGGTLTTLSNGSPKVSVTAADGAGTITATPTSIISGSTGNGISFSYTATAGGMDTGKITILVPTAFPTPTNSGFDPAGVQNLCSGDSPVISSVAGGHLITITSVSLAPNASCQINYGLPGFSGGWTAPSGTSTNIFTTSQQSYSSGSLVALGTSPTVTVTADGTGTMTLAPPHVVAGSAGNTLTLSYTPAVAMSSGVVTVDVPASWPAPSTTTSAQGYTTSTCGTVSAAAQKITVSAVTKAVAATCTITYGSTASGGPGATAPATGGLMTFTTQQKSTAGGTLLSLSSGSPQVSVSAPDGTGTMTASPTTIVSGSTGNGISFTYTATAGGLDTGKITILVPTAFPTPTNSGFDPAGVQNLCSGDSPVISSVAGGHLITITSVSLAPNASCQINYGLPGFSGGWTAPSGTSTYPFTASEASTAAGAITALGASPSVSLVQDGSGTMTVSPPTTSASSVHNTLAFTYTAGFPMSAGEVTIDIPAGWSAPSTTATAAGFSTTDCAGATVSAVGSTIHVSNLTLAGGASCTITYGDTSSGPGATASSSTGTITFNAKEKSTAGGTLTAIGTSPHVTAYAADGTGTFTVAPSTVATGATAQTLTFTYTAATGGMSGGRIELTVPTGWSVPSTTATAAGRTTSTCASVTIATRTIQLTNVGLSAGATCTITYGDKTGGGTGATAPTAQGASTFAATQKSSGPGALAALAASPSVTVGSVTPPTPNHTLTVTVTGSGSVAGPGIACPGTCTKTAAQGTTVALTATPAPGWALTSWGNAGCPGLGVCNIALNTDQTIAAVFQQLAVCTVKPTSPKVKVPATGKKGKPTLTVVVTCTQAVKATLSGKATETFTVKTTVKGKTKLVKKTVVVAFARTTKNLKAKTRTSYIVNVPPSVMNALKLKRATSVTFTLKTTNSIGATIVTVKIRQLRR